MRIKYGLICLSLVSCVGIYAGEPEHEKQLKEIRQQTKLEQEMVGLKISEQESQLNSSKFYYDSPCGSGGRSRSFSDEKKEKTGNFNLRTSNSDFVFFP